MRNPITVVRIQRRFRMSELKTSYTLRKDRKHFWLQRMCFAILDKLRCYSLAEHETVTRIPISNADFVRSIYDQYRNIIDECRLRPAAVYMGEVEFFKLTNSMNNRGIISDVTGVTIPVEIVERGRCMIYDLPVIVVPWLEGVFIAPRAEHLTQ